MYTNPILNKMIALNADGVDFIDPCHQNDRGDHFGSTLATYSKAAWKVAYGVAYPRSAYKFWKIIDGRKQYITERVDEKVFTIQDDDGDIICACSSLAGAQEMLIDLAFEDMYEDFLWSIHGEGMHPDEWFNMMWQDTLMHCAMFKQGINPLIKTVWAFLDFYTDHYYIRKEIPLMLDL